jgi:hypothetical protein
MERLHDASILRCSRLSSPNPRCPRDIHARLAEAVLSYTFVRITSLGALLIRCTSDAPETATEVSDMQSVPWRNTLDC